MPKTWISKNELKERLLKAGIESSLLDDTVHDAASQQASNANNGGLDSQVDFLLDTCGWTPQNILNALEIQA
jgi:hypothetical protein